MFEVTQALNNVKHLYGVDLTLSAAEVKLMKKDIDILNNILLAFSESETTLVTMHYVCDSVTAKGVTFEQFIFHYLLLVEEDLIGNANFTTVTNNLSDFGLLTEMDKIQKKKIFYVTHASLRITSKGLQFSDALSDSNIRTKLKEYGEKMSISSLTNLGSKLLEKAVMPLLFN